MARVTYNMSRSRISKLVAAPGVSVNEEVTTRLRRATYPFTAFDLPDGTLLIVDDRTGRGTLHEDKVAALSIISAPSSYAGPLHTACYGRVSDYETFVANADKAPAVLHASFGIPTNELTGEIGSLSRVDAGIERMLRRKSPLNIEMEVFDAIVAYVGIVIINVTRGIWQREFVESDGRDYPVIVTPVGQVFAPCGYVADRLDDPSGNGSIWAIVSAELGVRYGTR